MSTAGLDLLRTNPRTYARTADRTIADPTLFLDFQSATALDPRITFSRGSQATLFDSTGTLKYAKHNLLLQSEDFSTTWAATGATVTTNATTAPSGSATADKLIADSAITVSPSSVSAFVRQDITKAATATTYTFSLFAKAGEFNAVRLFARDNATSANNAAVTVLLTNGTVLTAAAAGGTFTNASVAITNAGNGWYRVALTFTSSTETTIRFIYAVGDSSTTTGDASKGIFIWGAQLNLANMEGGVTSSLTTYYPTTTAAYYAPRFDYNPSTLQPRGLLIEEARTNSLLQSQTFQTTWTATRSSISADSITAPDGTLTGDTLVEDTTASNSHRISQTFSATSGTTYTASVFVKAQSTRCLRIVFATAFASDAATINPTSGATQVNSGTTATSVADVGNGWYRFTVSATATSTATASIEFYTTVGLNTSVSYTGNGTSGVYIWGAQLEAGAFATSYIPTTTTALTRNADVASMTGTNFSSWYNASEGTFVTQYQVIAVAPATTTQTLLHISDGTINNAMEFYKRANADVSTRFAVGVGAAANQVFLNAGTFVSTPSKLANAYQTNNFAASLNAAAVVTDTVGNLPTVSQMFIGSNLSGASFVNGTINRISFYPTRLPNTTLQALTA